MLDSRSSTKNLTTPKAEKTIRHPDASQDAAITNSIETDMGFLPRLATAVIELGSWRDVKTQCYMMASRSYNRCIKVDIYISTLL
jgi:hypothetical protein